MKVSYSAFYLYAAGKSCLKSDKRERLERQVKEVFWFHSRNYGSRRISLELKDRGERVGRYRVRQLMREQGLMAKQPRRFRPRTTVSDNTKASPNLLKDESVPNLPKAVLVGDITYLPLSNGKWCYLAAFEDRVSRRVAGWKVSMRMTDSLVIGALDKALTRGFVRRGAIIHSDRGSQYNSRAFRELLAKHGLRQSMSGKGNCYDNAQAESFWARFKTELLDGGLFESVDQARSETFSYIEGYYNRIRKHSSLGYMSPEQFERQFENQNLKLAA
jgi:transposase InsO family protein